VNHRSPWTVGTGMRTTLLTLALLVVPSAALAGGGGHGFDACRGFADGDTVVLRDSCLDGIAHFAAAGALTVRNDGDQPHDYTDVERTFGSGVLQPGEETEISVEPGAYRVYCTLHASRDGDGMAGALIAAGTPVEAEPVSTSGASVPWAPLALLAVGLAALIGGQRIRASRRAAGSTS
jgi:hypothetical protein